MITNLAEELRDEAIRVQQDKANAFYIQTVSDMLNECRAAAQQGNLHCTQLVDFIEFGKGSIEVCDTLQSKICESGIVCKVTYQWSSNRQKYVLKINCSW